MCGDEPAFDKQQSCEESLLMTAVTEYWGTNFAMCLAHEELRRGIAQVGARALRDETATQRRPRDRVNVALVRRRTAGRRP